MGRVHDLSSFRFEIQVTETWCWIAFRVDIVWGFPYNLAQGQQSQVR